MVEVIVRKRKISDILFIVSLIVSFVSFYFDIPIIFILSMVYSAAIYLTVPRHETRTAEKVTMSTTFTVGAIISRPTTFTASSEKFLKAKVTNFEKTHKIAGKSEIKITEKDGQTEYSIIVQDITEPLDTK